MRLREDRAPVWAIWLLIAFGAVQPIALALGVGVPRHPFGLVPLLVVWVTLLVLAALATRRITALWQRLTQKEQAHSATLNEVDQLQTQNAMLDIIARSVDVPLAFQALATRIARLVPCDRVGLALLAEDGREFQTYTARVQPEERRSRPRPEIVFKVERTIIGKVVSSQEPLIIDNIREIAPDHLDANVLMTSGFNSAMVVPLVSRGRAVGTLNAVARHSGVFGRQHIDALLPIAEILAVAWVAQQLHMTLGKHRTMEVMSDLTLAVAAEINSALQTIIGHCDLLERGQPDEALQRDLRTIMSQAQRIMGLLDKMRTASNERLREMEATMSKEGIDPADGEEPASGDTPR
ncbi:MAG TPA: GAF domain-containing protein [Vicinamibacterales bacterium]|nr:GAF domain-containing protein [Vicinamibacterales bacterium]